jgi:hypothetical protein
MSAIGALKEVGSDSYEVTPAYSLFKERNFEKCFGPW